MGHDVSSIATHQPEARVMRRNIEQFMRPPSARRGRRLRIEFLIGFYLQPRVITASTMGVT
jgi:hypothetical protein